MAAAVDVVTASGEDEDSTPVSGNDSATVTVTDTAPVISVVNSANQTTVPEPGAPVSFTVEVINGSGSTDPVTLDSLLDDEEIMRVENELASLEAVLDAAVEAVTAAADGASVVGHSCDVRDADALATTHAAVVDALGPVDVLVNNAGTSAAGTGSAPPSTSQIRLRPFKLAVVA